MKEYLIKSHESIIENQRNSDSKANLFIILITGFLALFDEVNLNITTNQQNEGIEMLFIVLIAPLILLIISLLPRYNGRMIYVNRKKKMKLNIFYWKTMTYYTSHLELEDAISEKYQELEFSQQDKDLIEQIYVNSVILEAKSILHKSAFLIINQLIVIFSMSLIGTVLFNNDIWITLYLLMAIEILIVTYYFDIIPKIIKKFTGKNTQKY